MSLAPPRRVIWLNGAFGVGKTTTARLLAARLPGSSIVDPERWGWVLQHVVFRWRPWRDFQQMRSWRSGVRLQVWVAARRPGRRGPVVVPMTMVDPGARTDVLGWLRAHRTPVTEVVLAAPADVVVARADADTGDDRADWARKRVTDCVARLDRIPADCLVTTTSRSPDEVAEAVIASVAALAEDGSAAAGDGEPVGDREHDRLDPVVGRHPVVEGAQGDGVG